MPRGTAAAGLLPPPPAPLPNLYPLHSILPVLQIPNKQKGNKFGEKAGLNGEGTLLSLKFRIRIPTRLREQGKIAYWLEGGVHHKHLL